MNIERIAKLTSEMDDRYIKITSNVAGQFLEGAITYEELYKKIVLLKKDLEDEKAWLAEEFEKELGITDRDDLPEGHPLYKAR